MRVVRWYHYMAVIVVFMGAFGILTEFMVAWGLDGRPLSASRLLRGAALISAGLYVFFAKESRVDGR